MFFGFWGAFLAGALVGSNCCCENRCRNRCCCRNRCRRDCNCRNRC